MARESTYDPLWHSLRAVHRWFRNRCNENEDFTPFSDCVDFDESTGTYVIVFRGTDKDKEDVLRLLNERPME